MPKFMIILQSKPGDRRKFTPEQLQKKSASYQAWGNKMQASGRYVVGEKLGEEGGRLLSQENGRVSVVDGPYPETKEVVGGFVIIRAADYDEAVELLRDCPFVNDYTIAVRQTDPMGCGGE